MGSVNDQSFLMHIAKHSSSLGLVVIIANHVMPELRVKIFKKSANHITENLLIISNEIFKCYKTQR